MVRLALVTVSVIALLLTGCAGDRTLEWRKVSLPVPAGSTPALGDLVRCGDRFYAVGAVRAGATRHPAAWTSTDGTAWSSIPVAPASIYGPTSLLYAAGCRGEGGLAALGSAIGGAHGNPRTGTWILTQDALTENLAEFELFGGPRALSVNRIAGGALGWLVVGNRTDGAAAWPSTDGRTYTLTQVDGDGTQAFDVAATSNGWAVVGTRTEGARLVPMIWRSADGRSWRGQPVYDQGVLQRIAGDVAAGTSGDRLVIWHGKTGRVDEFASAADKAPGVPAVRSLAVDDENVLVAASDGARLRLWASDGTEVNSPVELAANGTNRLAVALRHGTAVVAADDGVTGSVWTAPFNG